MNDLLTDSFGRKHQYLRISVTDRCNLRCTYCMPEGGFPLMDSAEILSYEEITRFVKLLAPSGLSKVRLTGGEPLVRKDIHNLVAQLREISGIEKVALTTNGLLFNEQAKALKNAGLTGVNISLDTLSPEKFQRITRRTGWDLVRRSIDTALEFGLEEVKVNAVILRGMNEDELLDLAMLAQDLPIQMRFIESMPFMGNSWQKDALVSYEEMLTELSQDLELIPLVDPDQSHPISQDFFVPGFQGQIGIIASMTRSFCAGCERLRLQSNGGLKSCLFENAHTNVREALRRGDDQEVALMVQETLWSKAWEHAPAVELATQDLPVMTGVGG